MVQSYTSHARALLALGLPIIGSHLAQMALHVTDTVLLGWYGVTELAAVVHWRHRRSSWCSFWGRGLRRR